MEDLVAKSYAGVQIIVSKYHFPLKEKLVLNGKPSDSRFGAGNLQ